MAGEVAPEVLVHEADVPDENFGDDFNAPEFMTLEQAERKLQPIVFQKVKDDVWPNVVQIFVPIAQKKITYGTGFIFRGPGGEKSVMTNYHVVRKFDQGLNQPVQVMLDYDGPGRGRCIKVVGVQYHSRDGNRVDADHRDFCVLKLEQAPEVEGITLEPTTGRLNAMFDHNFWNSVNPLADEGQRFGEGLIVGHPRGSYKRISVVKLSHCEDVNSFTRAYEELGTRPGSSGSPVVCNCVNNATSPGWVYVLHFASGRGVTIVKVIEAINEQMQR